MSALRCDLPKGTMTEPIRGDDACRGVLDIYERWLPIVAHLQPTWSVDPTG